MMTDTLADITRRRKIANDLAADLTARVMASTPWLAMTNKDADDLAADISERLMMLSDEIADRQPA